MLGGLVVLGWIFFVGGFWAMEAALALLGR